MDLKIVSELIRLMNESKLSSLEIEEKDLRIKLEKIIKNVVDEEVSIDKRVITNKSFENNTAAKSTVNNETIDIKVDNSSTENHVIDLDVKLVKSPIVGTFYNSSSPEAEAFAPVGKNVKKGETLCIIEAMKLMNEIESEYDGEIVEVLIKNGSMVEYGQLLFKIK